jgi:hypothetical protein
MWVVVAVAGGGGGGGGWWWWWRWLVVVAAVVAAGGGGGGWWWRTAVIPLKKLVGGGVQHVLLLPGDGLEHAHDNGQRVFAGHLEQLFGLLHSVDHFDHLGRLVRRHLLHGFDEVGYIPAALVGALVDAVADDLDGGEAVEVVAPGQHRLLRGVDLGDPQSVLAKLGGHFFQGLDQAIGISILRVVVHYL